VHSNDENVETKLCRIAENARRDPFCQLKTEEMLRGCFMRLKDNAAAGIDEAPKW